MKCTQCGREIDDNHKFCQYCGATVKQPVVSPENTSQTNRCKNCGAILKPTSAFCAKCGTPVSATDVNVPTAKEKNKPGDGKTVGIIIAVIIIIALVLVALAGCYFADKKDLFDRQKESETLEMTEDHEPVSGEIEPEETDLKEEVEPEETDLEEESAPAEMEEESEPEAPAVEVNTDVDVEATVLQIRDEYSQITDGISSNSYDITIVDDGITAYSKQGQVKAIVVKKDYDGDEYARNFYFDRGELFFAYYEGLDSHRLYFYENQLIRWRYCADAADNDEAENHDMENSTSYHQWEQRVKEDALYLQNKWKDVSGAGNHATQIDMTNISAVDATSHLVESQHHIEHFPERVIDGKLKTGWVEGALGQGIGESITLSFDGMYLVSGMKINAGYQKSNDLYNKNSRPKEVYVEFSDGSGESFILEDVNDVQEKEFAYSVITDRITLRINSVYPGNKYEDTVISEIFLY